MKTGLTSGLNGNTCSEKKIKIARKGNSSVLL